MHIRHLYIILVLCTGLPGIMAAQLNANFRADSNYVCVNVPLQFTDLSTGNGITNWNWNFGNGEISALQNPIITYDTPGEYTVSLQISDGTTANTEVKQHYIIVRNMPAADFIYTEAVDSFINASFTLSSFDFIFTSTSTLPDSLDYNYYWDFGTGTFVDSQSVVWYHFTDAGNYTLRLVVEAGLSCTDTATVSITVDDELEVPTIFTPNDDGINDLLLIRTNGEVTYKLIIFNRWGTIVYTSVARKLFWDGYTPAGVLADPGPYFFNISSDDLDGYKKTGFFQLVR